ncbi:MAG TPA: chitobiase/beta-hexosaminidase C-terminal domain-containing protein [Kofleriaceae bacterium]|nr:chitobiase/beta-hexosaminidase C-terminal domain-containing protein [Kofleriaceae bacterium]
MPLVVAICTAGCNVVFGFDDIHPIDASVPPPTVFSSPGPRLHAMGYDFAEAVAVTLAADDPAAVIYYTTDGTTPSQSSKHGTTPVTGIAMSSTATLTYFGSATGGESATGSDTYDVTSAAQSVAGYYVTSVLLDGTSPVVVVSPGQVLSGATAKVQAWVQTSCPACAAQIVYGVDTTDQGCLFDSVRDAPTGPGGYPGFTHAETFKVTAPMTPGVHEVRITHSEQTTCAAAMAMHALVTRPDQSRIGVLIVE